MDTTTRQIQQPDGIDKGETGSTLARGFDDGQMVSMTGERGSATGKREFDDRRGGFGDGERRLANMETAGRDPGIQAEPCGSAFLL